MEYNYNLSKLDKTYIIAIGEMFCKPKKIS